MEREGRWPGGRRPSRSTPCRRPPSGRRGRQPAALSLQRLGAVRRRSGLPRGRAQQDDAQPREPRDLQHAEAVAPGRSAPARPRARRRRRPPRPASPVALGSSAVRSAATLTSRTHRPPRSSPPDPPRPCATGSIACQAATAWAGLVAWSSTTAAMPALKTIPLATSTTAQMSPTDGRHLRQGRRSVLQARVQGQRQDGQDEAEDHVGDQVHDLHARVVAHEHGHLLGGVHDIGVLHEQEEERHGDQIGHCQVEGRDAPGPLPSRSSGGGRVHL